MAGLSQNETSGPLALAMTQTMPQTRGAFGQSAFEDCNCPIDGEKYS